ncbi:MAG TPA: SCO5389 family protein [Pseudonocardiaceae bacterium]
MSLEVPVAMVEAAERGEVDDAEFVGVVRDSLPYAWHVVTTVVGDLGTRPEAEYAEHAVSPPDEGARGQLLRALASDAIRGALERHFGVRLAFQNCHSTRAYRPGAVGGASHREFTSARAQVLNQTPELRDC